VWGAPSKTVPITAERIEPLKVPAREDLIARIEQAYDTELLAIAMREVETRVQPHTWQAFRMLAIEGRPGSEVAALLGMEVSTAYVARSKVIGWWRTAPSRR